MGGPTPYCRGADGRAVLRSSVREFLAQEHMHALGVPTSRSLTLYVSKSETVQRPWYSADSRSSDPDILVDNPAAISTRVAPSFLRVGQLELFARRHRSSAHPDAREELRMILAHLVEREYASEIDPALPFEDQLVELAKAFRGRLTALVAGWLRVGYCQGNFNSDNCAAGGFTLDYGPFGFCEAFDRWFQPWTGGGRHFSILNQPGAAQANFDSLCSALRPLLEGDSGLLDELEAIRSGFTEQMELNLQAMWSSKLGLERFDAELYLDLLALMQHSRVDYTMFFRALCELPEDTSLLKATFHVRPSDEVRAGWMTWLTRWHALTQDRRENDREALIAQMKQVNPRYTWREWLVAPAYERAEVGDYTLVRQLQSLLSDPYVEQSTELAAASDQKRPMQFEGLGGVAHYSCSS